MNIHLIYSTNPQYELKSKFEVVIPDSIAKDYDAVQKYCYEKLLEKTGKPNINLWQFTSPNYQELKQLFHE